MVFLDLSVVFGFYGLMALFIAWRPIGDKLTEGQKGGYQNYNSASLHKELLNYQLKHYQK